MIPYRKGQKYNKGEKTKPRIPEPPRPVNHTNTFKFLLCNNQVMAGEFTKTIIPFARVGYDVIITNWRYALVGWLSLHIQRGRME